MCDKKCNEEGFQFHDIAAILVENNNLCRTCHNERLAERNESEVTNTRWKAVIGQKGSRGKLSASLGQMASSTGCGNDA